MTYIESGYGFQFGQNFKRAGQRIAIEVTDRRGGDVYGYIEDKDYGRIKVKTIVSGIVEA